MPVAFHYALRLRRLLASLGDGLRSMRLASVYPNDHCYLKTNYRYRNVYYHINKNEEYAPTFLFSQLFVKKYKNY